MQPRKKLVGDLGTDLSFSIADGKLERATGTVAKALDPAQAARHAARAAERSSGLDLGYEAQSARTAR